ncbi:MAG: SCO family protein [Candidatus Binatia bacterium]
MTAMRYRVLQLVIFLLLVALMSPARGGPPHHQQLKIERREVRIPINDFTLTDQGARRFEFKNLSGKVVVVSFSYTSCSDVCPLITAAARQVQSGLSAAERDRIYLLTVTTDPEIDTPKVLTAYAQRYGAELANWSFLTGREAELKKIWKNFGVGVKRKGRGIVEHTPLTAIVDQSKQLRYVYIGPSPDPKRVLTDVRDLLAQP